MSAAIAPVDPVVANATSSASAGQRKEVDIGDRFSSVIAEARATETAATQLAERFASGDPAVGIHEVMIMSEKANIAVRYATTLKNKAVEAYRELMNTQV